MEGTMNGYLYSRYWFDFRFENPDLCRSIHSELYLYIVDKWNRLGQKEKLGLPTEKTMEVLNIGSYNTYKKALNDLVVFGFIKVIVNSSNQHTSKVVALSKNDKASDKALDKATDEASDEPSDKPTDTIIEQKNNRTIEQKNSREEFSTEIINYLNRQLNTSYKTNTAKTRNLIKARVNEGFEIEDFKKVISNRKKLWFNDPEMKQYLRPETLFGNKFEGYLNSIPQSQKPEMDERMKAALQRAEEAKKDPRYVGHA